MTEAIVKHYYGGEVSEPMAVRAAELGWESWIHYHPFGEIGNEVPCNSLCRKVRVTP